MENGIVKTKGHKTNKVREHSFAKYVNPDLAKVLSQLAMDKVFVRGEGCYLFDAGGSRYLDFLAQYGALPFGFNHPYIWDAIDRIHQTAEPSFVQPSYLNAASELAKRLVEIAPPGLRYVTFANSGAEAVEAAIKLCKAATGRAEILAANNSFHGKTLGALSATDKKKYQERFGAPVPGYRYVPFGDVGALECALSTGRYAAFIVEPIQGEGGIVEAPAGYLAQARQICKALGTLLVADEIQTGLGRTGTMFACDAERVTPDVMVLAKALGGGLLPIGACLYGPEAYTDHFALKHTSTFAGNTLACRAGIATLDLLERDSCQLIRKVAENGARMKRSLLDLKERYPLILDAVRGRGYMLGITFAANRYDWDSGLLGCFGGTEVFTSLIVSWLLNREKVRVGYTLNQGGVLRVEPPLTASWEECESFLEALERTLVALDRRNIAFFTAHISRLDLAQANAQLTSSKAERFQVSRDAGRFAFLLHPLTLDNYSDIDPSLALLNEDQMQHLANCIADNCDPCVIGEASVTSRTGARAHGEFIIIPRTAQELIQMRYSEALDEIRAAAELAKRRGARIIGLGAYTSVVCGAGLYLKGSGLPALTTGNSYTVFAARQAIQNAIKIKGYNPGDCKIAIVGASGSIGRALSILLAEDAGKLILIGNADHPAQSRRRLLDVAGEMLRHIRMVELQGRMPPSGSSFHANGLSWPLEPHRGSKAEWSKFAEEVERSSGFLSITCDVSTEVQAADVVVTATSAANEILDSCDLNSGSIVCDISRPPNVAKSFRKLRPDVFLIEGGVIQPPEGTVLNFNLDLSPGYIYACMAETMMLSLEHRYEDMSLGIDLEIGQVFEMAQLAERHGFKVAIGKNGSETYYKTGASEISSPVSKLIASA